MLACEALAMQPVYQFNVNMKLLWCLKLKHNNSFKGPNNILYFIQFFVNVGVISFHLY